MPPRLNRLNTMAAKAIPDGFDALIPSLVVRDGAKAIEWYKELFHATELFRMNYPDNPRMIAHAELRIRGHVLMLSDENPAFCTQSPLSLNGQSPVTVMFYVPEVDAVYEKAISMGATPVMPPTDMFWGDRFSKFADPFGHLWAIATHIKDVTPDELARGAEEAFKKE